MSRVRGDRLDTDSLNPRQLTFHAGLPITVYRLTFLSSPLRSDRMADEAENGITRSMAREHVERAVRFVGRDWVVDTHHEFYEVKRGTHQTQGGPPPLIEQYNRALEELGYDEAEAPEILPPDFLSESTFRLMNLGRYLSDLNRAKTYFMDSGETSPGVSDKFQKRLRNGDEYSKAVFELQVAAGYARQGHSVHLIEESGVRAPDIKLPLSQDVMIECKRVDRSPGAAQEREGRYEVLLGTTTASLHREGIVLFDLTRLPKMGEAQSVDQHFPEDTHRTREHVIEVPFGTIFIYPFLEPGVNKRVVKVSGRGVHDFQQFLELEVLPVLRAKYSNGFELEQLDNATLESNVKGDEFSLTYRNPLFVGVLLDSSDDYLQTIVNQFKRISGKFNRETANLLHIDVPNLDDFSPSELEKLEHQFGRKLNVNSRITAVVVSTEVFEFAPDGRAAYGHLAANVPNFDPAVELPEGFTLPGSAVSVLADHPVFVDNDGIGF